MSEYKSYSEVLECSHDFIVEYRFLTAEEGGRITGTPIQRYYSDFWYEHDNQKENRLYKIHPEFLDIKGEPITNTDSRVPEKGMASMWIMHDQMRGFHQKNIKVGLTCYFMEGSRKVAICTVTEITGLMTNPTGEV